MFSFGTFGFGRDELTLTPRQSPPFEPGRTRSETTRVRLAFGAAAFRTPTWAIAPFWDRSQRIAHRFITALNHLRTSAIPGFIGTEHGTGIAEFALDLTRVGGAVAVGSPSRRVSAGGAVYAIRAAVNASASVTTTSVAVFYAPYVPSRTERVSTDTNITRGSAWRLGMIAGLSVETRGGFMLAGRIQHDPALSLSRWIMNSDSVQGSTEPVELDPPDVMAVSASFSAGRTTVGGEVARLAYGGVYGPLDPPDSPNSVCQTLGNSRCSGWGFGPYRATDAVAVRVGLEQGVPIGLGVLRLRGGLAFENGYTVARSRNDPDLNGGSLPAPVVTTAFVPPRLSSTTLAWGAGYAWRGVELAAGLSHTRAEHRVLVDVRVSR